MNLLLLFTLQLGVLPSKKPSFPSFPRGKRKCFITLSTTRFPLSFHSVALALTRMLSGCGHYSPTRSFSLLRNLANICAHFN